MRRAYFPVSAKAYAASLLLLTAAIPAQADTDFNGDGLCDVWQQMHNAWELVPEEDADNDGQSNLAESIAGTSPFLAADVFRITQAQVAGANVVARVKSVIGKRYQLMSSDSPGGPTWTNEGPAVPGTGLPLELSASQGDSADRRFYKVETHDDDTDEDGISDWAESAVGTDPTLATSPGNASGGTAPDGEVLASLFSLSMESVTGDEPALEKESTTSRLRLVRAADKAGMRLTVAYGSLPNPDPTKGTTTGADYTLSTPLAGGMVTGTALGTLTIPAGAAQMDIVVTPVKDSLPEVPEMVRLNLQKPGYTTATAATAASAMIADADPAPEANRTLFVAYLGKEAGVTTTATGIATALVNGDNNTAEISLTFSNLTSSQNTAYLRVDGGLEIINVGLGQVSGRQWEIRAAQTKFTDQAMLNALHAGQLFINITTADNPEGEIRGYFNRASGSTQFVYNPDIHDAPHLDSEAWQPPVNAALERDIWRFLDQCTYGGTEALYQEVLAEVNSAVAGGGTYLDGYEAWLNKQMDPGVTPNASLMQLVLAADNEEFLLRGNKPVWAGNDPKFGGVSYTVSYDTFGNPTISTATDGTYNNNHPFHNNRRREQWTLAMTARAQVRQRMAQALSEILVISELDQTVQDRHYGAAAYWDMLADNAFGKYRDLLEKVSYSPMMGIYLSHLSNRAAYISNGVSINPDENYAREIMQLFSIGLVMRHPDGALVLGQNGLPIPTYDNDDITELARVMTGFCIGARHSLVNVQRFNGLQMVTSNNQRIGPSIEFQGGANVAGVSFTNFTEGAGDRWYQAPWVYPMKVLGRINTITTSNRPFHDFGTKTLLHNYNGGTVLEGITDVQLNALSTDQSHARAVQDISQAHNLLAGNPASGSYNGHPNTPVNISRWLIQRLTSSNPSSGYLYRVSEVYRDTNGNLGAVLKAILLDYEARSLQLADSSVSQGRMKEPLVHFMSIMRGLKAYSGMPLQNLTDMQIPFSNTDAMALPGTAMNLPAGELAKYIPGATRFRFGDQTGTLGQSPLRAPSVFNWFLPDYVVPGPMAEAGLFAPEMQLASETNLVNRINRLWTFTWANLTGMTAFPGSGVDDVLNTLPSRAAPQVKVHPPPATTTANNFLPLATLTFTPSNWSTAQTVTVAAVDDVEMEGSHTTTISHRAISSDTKYNNLQLPTVNVTLDDNESGGGAGVILQESGEDTLVVERGATDTYTLRLATQPTSNVTIQTQAVITGANNLTQVTVSPVSVTFTSSNWNSPQTLTVTAVNDSSNEGPHVGIIGHHITTADSVYRKVDAPSLQAIVADFQDNGSNAITITQTQNSTMVLEGGETDTFKVTLRKAPPTTNPIVTLQPAANTQVTLSPSTLTFTNANYNIPQTVTVTAVNDAAQEGTHTTTIAYASSGGGYTNTASVPVTINDNDGGGATITESGGTTTATEGASLTGLDNYTIRLNAAPTANVTVEVIPQRHPQRIGNYSKAMGYFASDLPASNQQKDNIIFDYGDILTLYNNTFTTAGGVNGSSASNVNAHFAAVVAVVDKFDLWWCGGQLKAQLPQLTVADLSNPAIVHPRKSIVAAMLYSYSTSRGKTESSYAAEARDRCRAMAYLVSICPQSFNAR